MSITEHEIEIVSSETEDGTTGLDVPDGRDLEAGAGSTESACASSTVDTEPAADDAAAKSEPAVKANAHKSRNEGKTTASGDDPAEENTSRQVSVSVRTLLLASVIGLLVVGLAVLGWLYIGAENKLSAQARAASNSKHAQEIALDYAVHAAEMNVQDLNKWKADLVKHTSPELKEKLTKAAKDMEQILEPLQWNSTAKPLAAIVRSDAGGTYTVDAFISVLTKTVQAPEGLQSTATYSLTIDSNKDWQISDVGGIDAALGSK